MNSRSVTWNGVTYKDAATAARAIGISRASMYYRLKCGYTCDGDINPYGAHFANPVVWNGITYPSQTAAAKALGITQATMCYRLKRGYTCDADVRPLGTEKSPKQRYRIEHLDNDEIMIHGTEWGINITQDPELIVYELARRDYELDELRKQIDSLTA